MEIYGLGVAISFWMSAYSCSELSGPASGGVACGAQAPHLDRFLEILGSAAATPISRASGTNWTAWRVRIAGNVWR